MATPFFPFYPLGFRCNPFRVLTDEEWVEVAIIPPDLRTALGNDYSNLQILGEKGYGKTTLLLTIAAEKRQSGHRVTYERIPEDGRTFQTAIQNLDYFFLDEVQRLKQNERKRLLSQTNAPRLIIATHENLTPFFSAHKRPLTTIALDQTNPAHLQAVLNRRLSYFSLNRDSPATFSEETINHLWNKFGRNFRAAEQYLYEQFQQLISEARGEDLPDWFINLAVGTDLDDNDQSTQSTNQPN